MIAPGKAILAPRRRLWLPRRGIQRPFPQMPRGPRRGVAAGGVPIFDMGTPGKAVLTASGKRGLLASGKAALFNADGECPVCCGKWKLTPCSNYVDPPVEYVITTTNLQSYYNANKIVRLSDGICYTIEPTTSTETPAPVTVIQSFDDCTTCVCVLTLAIEDRDPESAPRDVFLEFYGDLYVLALPDSPQLFTVNGGVITVFYYADSGICHHRIRPYVNGVARNWGSGASELIDTRETGQHIDTITLSAGDRLQIYLRNTDASDPSKTCTIGIDGFHDEVGRGTEVHYGDDCCFLVVDFAFGNGDCNCGSDACTGVQVPMAPQGGFTNEPAWPHVSFQYEGGQYGWKWIANVFAGPTPHFATCWSMLGSNYGDEHYPPNGRGTWTELAGTNDLTRFDVDSEYAPGCPEFET